MRIISSYDDAIIMDVYRDKMNGGILLIQIDDGSIDDISLQSIRLNRDQVKKMWEFLGGVLNE